MALIWTKFMVFWYRLLLPSTIIHCRFLWPCLVLQVHFSGDKNEIKKHLLVHRRNRMASISNLPQSDFLSTLLVLKLVFLIVSSINFIFCSIERMCFEPVILLGDFHGNLEVLAVIAGKYPTAWLKARRQFYYSSWVIAEKSSYMSSSNQIDSRVPWILLFTIQRKFV